MTTQAQAFRDTHAAYFFEDAHHLVEAEASVLAKEVRHNVFLFPDNSVLVIDNLRAQTAVLAELPTA